MTRFRNFVELNLWICKSFKAKHRSSTCCLLGYGLLWALSNRTCVVVCVCTPLQLINFSSRRAHYYSRKVISLCDFITHMQKRKQKIHLALCWDDNCLICFKLAVFLEIIRLCSWCTSVWMTLFFIQREMGSRKWKLLCTLGFKHSS